MGLEDSSITVEVDVLAEIPRTAGPVGDGEKTRLRKASVILYHPHLSLRREPTAGDRYHDYHHYHYYLLSYYYHIIIIIIISLSYYHYH